MTARADTETGTKARQSLFLVIAALLPVALLVGVEMTLRGVDAFPREPLFIENPRFPEYSLANPNVVHRFFSHPAMAPNVSIETAFFRTEKTPGTLRLVVQGGSSAAGFPFGYGASLAGMLEQRLRREFPERPVEVISTAMSAVNSYALLDFVDEILELEPDAVLIYAGHNEYLGILGVGSALSSSQSLFLTRMIMGLRHFRLYRAIERAFAPAFGSASSEEERDEGTLMARIAAERHIAYGSELFRRGQEQFARNLRDIVTRYSESGVPVFLGTLVSNESDQPPFIDALDSSARSKTDAAEYDPPDVGAERLSRQAIELDEQASSGSAVSAFRLGRLLLAEGDLPAAQVAFRRARDLDQLRFRAPDSFNEVIRGMGKGSGARLVDVESAFRRATPNGLIGRDLITEHLHPNVDGYFLLADAFHAALLREGILPEGGAVIPAARARAEIPVSGVDAIFGRYKLIRLMSHWPFTTAPGEPVLPEPVTFEEQLARQLFDKKIDWTAAHRQLQSRYAAGGDRREYLRLCLILADAFPFSPQDQYLAGVALQGAGRHLQAVRYLLRADHYRPKDKKTLVALGKAGMDAGLDEIAVRALERARALDPSDAAIRALLEQARR